MKKIEDYINQDFINAQNDLSFCLSLKELSTTSVYKYGIIFYDSAIDRFVKTGLSKTKLTRQYKWLGTTELQSAAYHRIIKVIFTNSDSYWESLIVKDINASKM